MKGLTLTQREQTRLQVLNRLVAQQLTTREAAAILGLSERHTWRMLAAYRKEGAAALAHGNRGRRPRNAVGAETRQKVTTLGRSAVSRTGQSRAQEDAPDCGTNAVRFREVVERIGPGGLSHRQAARELDIGFATLKRLLEAGEPPTVATKPPRPTLLPSVNGRYTPETEETDIIA